MAEPELASLQRLAFSTLCKEAFVSLYDSYARLPRERMGVPKSDRAHPLLRELNTWIKTDDFPCVGAKAALARGQMSAIVLPDIQTSVGDQRLHAALLAFVARSKANPSLFQSFAAIFETPDDLDELAFERRLWERVQSASDLDLDLGHRWDDRVSADPTSPHCSRARLLLLPHNVR